MQPGAVTVKSLQSDGKHEEEKRQHNTEQRIKGNLCGENMSNKKLVSAQVGLKYGLAYTPLSNSKNFWELSKFTHKKRKTSNVRATGIVLTAASVCEVRESKSIDQTASIPNVKSKHCTSVCLLSTSVWVLVFHAVSVRTRFGIESISSKEFGYKHQLDHLPPLICRVSEDDCC